MSVPNTLKIVCAAGVIKDISLVSLANGKISFQPTDNNDVPIPVTVADGTQTLSEAITRTISGGAMTGSDVFVPNPASASPQNYRLRICVTDSSTNKTTVYRNVLVYDAGSGQWSMSNLNAGYASPQIPLVKGPQGQGFNFRGAWAPNTAYAAYDVITYNGSSYTAVAAFTSGSSFDATNLSLWASRGTDGATTPNFTSTITAPGVTSSGPVVGSSVGVASGKVADASGNILNAAFAVYDNDNNTAFYIDANGNTFLSGSLSVAGTTNLSASKVSNTGGTLDAASSPDYLWWVADSSYEGRVALGVKADGTIVGTMANDPNLTLFQDPTGMYWYTKRVGGYYHIFTYDKKTVTETQITSGQNNNNAPRLSPDGNQILFRTDRTGSFQNYQMLLSGKDQLPITIDPATAFQINHVALTGQSLAVGLNSTPPLSTTQPYNNIMFNGGPCVVSRAGAALVPSNYASFSPLIEVTDVETSISFGETMMSAFCNRVSYEMAKFGKQHNMLATVNGYSGVPYASLQKGTATYNNGLTLSSAAKALAAASSQSYGVRAVLVEHGQADDISGNANYWQNLLTWQANYEADYQAITGQKLSIPMIITQLSEDWLTGSVAFQQLKAATLNPDGIILSTPTYNLVHNSDGIHLPNYSEQMVGEYQSKPYVARMLGKSWRPLTIKSAVLIGKTIIAEFYVPVAPLVIDTTNVTEPSVPGSKYGFEFSDGSGSPPSITSVTVIAPTTLEIGLSAVPAAGTRYLSYAYTKGSSGLARGNLRDSDTYRSLTGNGITINGVTNCLPNWCLHQHFQIS